MSNGVPSRRARESQTENLDDYGQILRFPGASSAEEVAFDRSWLGNVAEVSVFTEDAVALPELPPGVYLVKGALGSSLVLEAPEVAETRMRLASLEARVAVLERELGALKKTFPEGEMVTLRDITREEAREEVRRLFATGKTFYMSEVADQLNLPDQFVVEVCVELVREGELQLDADALRSR